MFDSFLHPGYLAVGAALISAPIIIHLINRLRFKRIRWAAMEFLLKAQKRNRRRLIIEQLILLALRCLLVAMVGLLVARFVGVSIAGFGKKQQLHIALLDDRLSMNDEWKEGENAKTCFTVGRDDVLRDKIIKELRGFTSNDKVIVLPLSQAHSTEDLKFYEKLNDNTRYGELEADLKQLKPTKLHLNLVDGINRADKIVEEDKNHDITLHVISDFRQKEWGQDGGAQLYEKLLEFSRSRKALVRLLDTAHPSRGTNLSVPPRCHDNVGILDFRPNTRIAGKDMTVAFTISVANYSDRDAAVNVVIVDDIDGKERQDLDFNPPLPLKIPARGTAQASFEARFSPQLKGNEPFFAPLSAHLESEQRGKLADDGLPQDNTAHAVVEIRDQVPVLVIDGEGKAGREEEKTGKDSYYLQQALLSVPGGSYRVDFGDMLGGSGGVPVKALERPDLRNFPSIILTNVRDLTPKQLANLETYVKDGGGLGIFLGPLVSVPYYNKNLYKEGRGLFPLPLKEPYYPPPGQPELNNEYTGAPMVLMRDDVFRDMAKYPIFGAFLQDASRRAALNDLPIKRYFQAVRRTQAASVHELATLPNEQPITNYTAQVLDIVRNKFEKAMQAGDAEGEGADLAKYRRGLDRHRKILETLVGPTSDKKAHFLAIALNDILMDKGKEKQEAEFPDLTEFWKFPAARALKGDIEALRDQVKYGDPFVVSRTFGKGRVVAIMTTAGKAWNSWAGGSTGTATFQPFVWEMQNYLSSQGSETNLTVGTPVTIAVESEPYKQGNRRVKMERFSYKTFRDKKAEIVHEGSQFGVENQGMLTFAYPRNYEPGVYVAKLSYDEPGERPLAMWGHVFNVDTANEGPLQRVNHDVIKTNFLDKSDKVTFAGAEVTGSDIVPPKSDFSESPWLFLLFLIVLIAEQALAVHLSFHLKGGDNQVLAPPPQARASAAA